MISFIINSDNSGQTLEKFTKKVLPNASLSFIYKLFRKKDVKVNGHWQDLKYIINENDEVRIYVTDEQLEEFKNKKIVEARDEISSSIIYEDNNILIINKPRNLLVQKDDSGDRALDDMILSYLAGKGEYNALEGFTPGPAHRIDRNTSGIVLFGKNIKTLQYLFSIFKDHDQIGKHYLALVKGHVENSGEVNVPLFKDNRSGKVYPSSKEKGAKEARTIYRVVEYIGDFTLLDLVLVTGRTHQIRVHMAYINHPLVGDSKYGDFELNKEIYNKYHFLNQFLHASEIHFGNLKAPLEGIKKQSFKANMPEEYITLINNIKKRIE